MKTSLRVLLFLALLCSCPAWATTYYANGLTSQNVNYTTAGAGWYTVQGASCVATGTSVAVGSFANGDVLNLNGCTAVALNVDVGAATGASAGVCGTVTVTVTVTTDATNGGSASYATATNLVIHANFTATKTTVLAITGSTGGGTLCGTATGGSTASQLGVTDAHTSVTTYLIGNGVGGSAGSAYGYAITNNGPVTVVGNGTAGTGTSAFGISDTSTGTITMTGNCIGSNTINAIGCNMSSTGVLALTGNVINGLKGSGQAGGILFTPSTSNYILSPKDASYTLNTINTHSTLMCPLSGTGSCASSGASSNGYAY